ncbi:MAG: hypothetical protein RR135_00445 [Oscillospiraceae bacterium]
MKKFLAFVLVLALTMSLAACGGKSPSSAAAAPVAPSKASSAAAPSSPATSAPVPKPAAKPTADLKNPEYTDAQMAVAEKFATMSDRFQTLADTINADPNLLAVEELVDTMNTMIDAVNADDELFANPANLTPEVLKNLEEDIVAGNTFLNEIEAMVKN